MASSPSSRSCRPGTTRLVATSPASPKASPATTARPRRRRKRETRTPPRPGGRRRAQPPWASLSGAVGIRLSATAAIEPIRAPVWSVVARAAIVPGPEGDQGGRGERRPRVANRQQPAGAERHHDHRGRAGLRLAGAVEHADGEPEGGASDDDREHDPGSGPGRKQSPTAARVAAQPDDGGEQAARQEQAGVDAVPLGDADDREPDRRQQEADGKAAAGVREHEHRRTQPGQPEAQPGDAGHHRVTTMARTAKRTIQSQIEPCVRPRRSASSP